MYRWWLLLLLPSTLLACKPAGPTSFPDQDKVVAAQKKWCAGLASVAGDNWLHQDDCEAAYPTGSAAFVAQMAECYPEQVAGLGEDAPDSAAILSLCSDQILIGADPGDVSRTAVVTTRCARMERCEKVSREECLAAFDTLNGMQQAIFTSMYNLRAQAQIATCFDELECQDDEDEARAQCYREPSDARVWLPLSLAADETVAPRPSD
jgi:hypothetical protein